MMRPFHSRTTSPASPVRTPSVRPSRRRSPAVVGVLGTVLGIGAALAATGATEREAHASGYLAARFGSDHGTPAMGNTFAVYFNPAAMGGATGTRLSLDASVLYRYAQYNRGEDGISPSDPAQRDNPTYLQANTGTAKLQNMLALPFLGFMTDFGGTNFRLGVASYIPFGGAAMWDRVDATPGVPGSKDGVQRWHNISGQILAIYNTLAASYTIEPLDLTVGLSGSLVYHTVKTVRARNADGSDDLASSSGRIIEGRSLLEAHGVNFGAGAGLYWQPKKLAGYSMKDRFRVGLSYTSQPGFGDTRMKGELTQVLGSGKPGVDPIDFLQTYPDIVRLGVAHRFPGDKLEIRADGEFVRWSVFKRQCVVKPGTDCPINEADGSAANPQAAQDIILNVERNWQNAYGLRAGAAYWFMPELEGFFSLGFTTPAVPKSTIDASTIDSQRVYATLGGKYEFGKHFELAGSYNHIFFVPVDTGNNNKFDRLQGASRSPSADGKYASQIGFLNINGTYKF